MEVGITNEIKKIVTDDVTAKAMASGALDVFGTPAMIAFIEECALQSIASELDEGMTTVGTKLDVAHLAATPVGMEVRCETKLIEIDRKRLVFEAKVYDEVGLVGEGKHERFIVDAEAFMAKAEGKKA